MAYLPYTDVNTSGLLRIDNGGFNINFTMPDITNHTTGTYQVCVYVCVGGRGGGSGVPIGGVDTTGGALRCLGWGVEDTQRTPSGGVCQGGGELQVHASTYGGAAQLEVGYLTVRASWPSAFTLCPIPCSHVNTILPHPRTPDVLTPLQDWLAI